MTEAYSIDVSRGQMRGEVSAQWASRPDDQKFLSVEELSAFVNGVAERAKTHEMSLLDDFEFGVEENVLSVKAGGIDLLPTNFAFGQLATMAGIQPRTLMRMPAELASLNLNWAAADRNDNVSVYTVGRQYGNGVDLRSINAPGYSRVHDRYIVDHIKALVDKTDGRWKVPGMIDWGSMKYDPEVPVSKSTTTLYASDRDCFIFLVDDRNPIPVGLLKNGDPDLMFRGFYAWNSEVGTRSAGVATMFLRGICANRCLWGVEGFRDVKIVHRGDAMGKVDDMLVPMLAKFVENETSKVVEGVAQAKTRKIAAENDEERVEFLMKVGGFGKKQSEAMLGLHVEMEERPIENLWDASQAATAYARRIPHTDARLDLEKKAGRILDMVKV